MVNSGAEDVGSSLARLTLLQTPRPNSSWSWYLPANSRRAVSSQPNGGNEGLGVVTVVASLLFSCMARLFSSPGNSSNLPFVSEISLFWTGVIGGVRMHAPLTEADGFERVHSDGDGGAMVCMGPG